MRICSSLLLVLLAFLTGCKTPPLAKPGETAGAGPASLTGLWVAKDLVEKLGGGSPTNDPDDTLPVLRIEGESWCMMDQQMPEEGHLIRDVHGDNLAVDFFGGLTLTDLEPTLGRNDASELMKSRPIDLVDHGRELHMTVDTNFSSKMGEDAGHREGYISFIRLIASSEGLSSLPQADQKLVGDWDCELPDLQAPITKADDKRVVKAYTRTYPKTRGLSLSADHTYLMQYSELISGTWSLQGSTLVLRQLKCSSHNRLAPELTLEVSKDAKTLRWAPEGKAMAEFVRSQA